MAVKTITLKVGDPCPSCGGPLRKAPQPTDEQRAKAANREDPIPLSPYVDTAPKAVVEECGDLYTCPCGYTDRIKPAASAPVQAVRATSAQ